MKDSTEGAWLISHSRKLLNVPEVHDLEDIEIAGKCGVFLSNLAASDDSEVNADLVKDILKVSNIKKSEADTIIRHLKEAQLIDVSKQGSIYVLGISTASVLGHTSSIFKNFEPSNFQNAALDLAESISEMPKSGGLLSEYIEDTHKLSSNEARTLFAISEAATLVDFEKVDNGEKLYFNGNLFRRNSADKINSIVNTLTSDEISKIRDLDDFLVRYGCIPLDKAVTILGSNLLSKLQAIGMYDFNEVSNPDESKVLLTKPSAFAKFGNPFEEDALDLAKAFVASLYYGMNFRSSSRGKINMLRELMKKLIRGEEVGPATAIGNDYQLLEFKRVVKIRHEGGYYYFMKLLKKDVGRLALQVLEQGDASGQSITEQVAGKSVTAYSGPEELRVLSRKSTAMQGKNISEMLRRFRN